MPVATQHPGETIILAGQEYILAPLRVRQMKQVVPRIFASSRDPLSMTGLTDIAEAFAIALSLNYPNLTIEAFLDLPITLDEFRQATPALVRAAGLAQAQAADPPAEAANA